jgi:hypothetical protein
MLLMLTLNLPWAGAVVRRSCAVDGLIGRQSWSLRAQGGALRGSSASSTWARLRAGAATGFSRRAWGRDCVLLGVANRREPVGADQRGLPSALAAPLQHMLPGHFGLRARLRRRLVQDHGAGRLQVQPGTDVLARRASSRPEHPSMARITQTASDVAIDTERFSCPGRGRGSPLCVSSGATSPTCHDGARSNHHSHLFLPHRASDRARYGCPPYEDPVPQ